MEKFKNEGLHKGTKLKSLKKTVSRKPKTKVAVPKRLTEAKLKGKKIKSKTISEVATKESGKCEENLEKRLDEETKHSKISKKRKAAKNITEEQHDKGKKAKILPTLEPIELEEKFNSIVNYSKVQKICKALKTLVTKEVDEKKSIFDDYRYLLNVTSYKIADCPKRVVKLNLKNSLVNTDDDDVIIIVPDLKRGGDPELTIQHYEDIFHKMEITGLKIMPFRQLRNEYTTFESLRKLANTYDYFLCDGRIIGHVNGFCGKIFQKSRTTYHSVRLNNPQLYKREIERSLKRTAYRQLEKGNLFSIPVGNNRFSPRELTENILHIVAQLKTIFPGGLNNIRNMHLKIDIKGTSSLPLYINLAGPPAECPYVIGPREQRTLKLKKNANEVLSKFSLRKTGHFVKLDEAQLMRKRQLKEAQENLSSKIHSESDVDNNDGIME
uniref:Uncharacterized protein n=1 Tax=Glossina pallidipes TaxID=7398 RepID=A0A1B0AD32_GLOPL